MTILHTKNIPSTFQKLDDSVSAADRFIGVYERQKILENFNLLMARRAPRTLVAGACVDGINSFDTPAHLVMVGDYDERPYNKFWTSLLHIAPWVSVLDIFVYFNTSLAATNVFVKAAFHPIGEGDVVEQTTEVSENAVLSAKSCTEHQISLAVRPGPSGYGYLCLQAEGGGKDGAAIASGQTILDSGYDFVDVSYSAAIDDIIDFSDTTIAPVAVSAVTSLTGGNYRYNIRNRFEPYPPKPGGDTASFWNPVTVDIASVSVNEQAIETAFYGS